MGFGFRGDDEAAGAAVVSVRGATRTLVDGEEVIVDGTMGTVTRVG